MTEILFYEKPGCVNNTRQKQLLEASGYTVIAKNLLTHPWTREELEEFFFLLPVSEWFNRSAPQVTAGEIDPDRIDEETAYRLMLKEPLLIRRPLMQIGRNKLIGFEPGKVAALLQGVDDVPDNLEQCPRKAEGTVCN